MKPPCLSVIIVTVTAVERVVYELSDFKAESLRLLAVRGREQQWRQW